METSQKEIAIVAMVFLPATFFAVIIRAQSKQLFWSPTNNLNYIIQQLHYLHGTTFQTAHADQARDTAQNLDKLEKKQEFRELCKI